jgi:hypothetical protein
MTDMDRLIDDIERRLAVLRQQRDPLLHRLGNLDGQIQALTEMLAGNRGKRFADFKLESALAALDRRAAGALRHQTDLA